LQTDVSYLDISKAFETVSHQILLHKLWSIGITGPWFKNYLTIDQPFPRVSINIVYSDLLSVVLGVPQRSILGPLLFLVYIYDMFQNAQCHVLKFANVSITLNLSQIRMQCIKALFVWLQDNDLNFNIKKSIHLSFKQKFLTTYSLFHSIVPHVDSHRDLGIALSEDLSWEKHHDTIIARAYI